MQITKSIITENPCYKAGRSIRPKGIMVHSTATPGVMAKGWFSRWNKPSIEKAVHAFIDDKDICQHLPWDHRAWHCGAAGNNTHISFEICEPKDWTTNKDYFEAAYKNAVELTVYLCKTYSIVPRNCISHAEGYRLGIASNHGDPAHWWKYFGKTMDDFRADVTALLGKTDTENPVVSVDDTRAVLRLSSTGNDVKYLQERLNAQQKTLALDFKVLDTDGIFGQKTLAAVKEFQDKLGLTVDGIVGEKTWGALENNYTPVKKPTKRPLVKYGSQGDDVRYLQTRLNALRLSLNMKFTALSVDGIFGAKTLAAVKEFQKVKRLDVDGLVGELTWGAINV